MIATPACSGSDASLHRGAALFRHHPTTLATPPALADARTEAKKLPPGVYECDNKTAAVLDVPEKL